MAAVPLAPDPSRPTARPQDPEAPVLPPAHRLRSSREFASVIRRGRRSSRPLLTVHLLPASAGPAGAAAPAEPPALPQRPRDARGGTLAREDVAVCGVAVGPARAGLVVSKAVGGSVVRHRTARRLRHLLAPHLTGPTADVPSGTALVVRAAPAAGTATSAALGADLDAALARLLQPRGST